MSHFDSYPYPIHTNRELDAMTAGTKPLAVFAHERVAGFEKIDALAGQDFGDLIATGKVCEHFRTYKRQTPKGFPIDIDYYFYTLKDEEWRVEAYCLLIDILHKRGSCSHLEWLEGTLLGYTEEQNEYHQSQQYKHHLPSNR